MGASHVGAELVRILNRDIKEVNFKGFMNSSSKNYLRANKTWRLWGVKHSILRSVCNYLNIFYENTRNLISVFPFQHHHAKNSNINSITIPVMKANTGASRTFLKEEDVTKLVNVHKKLTDLLLYYQILSTLKLHTKKLCLYTTHFQIKQKRH